MKAKQTLIPTLVGMVWVLALTTLVAAEPPAPAGQTKSMDDMMQECRTHCQATTNTIDQMTTGMEEAKRSNDPAQMRAAIEQAQKPLAEMKDHMGMCLNMMSMMQNMHGSMGGHKGGMGGHMGGMMQEEGSASGAESR